MIKFLPNSLTILRVIAIPFFIYSILINKPMIGLIIFVGASITDYFDGLIARKLNIVSNFGKLMDPLADKILVISALIMLNINPIAYLHWVITIIIAFREIAVTILREYYHNKGVIIPANFAGKIKTTLQMIGIITALTLYTVINRKFIPFITGYETALIIYIQIYFWFTAIVTVVSGMNYFLVKPTRLKI